MCLVLAASVKFKLQNSKYIYLPSRSVSGPAFTSHYNCKASHLYLLSLSWWAWVHRVFALCAGELYLEIIRQNESCEEINLSAQLGTADADCWLERTGTHHCVVHYLVKINNVYIDFPYHDTTSNEFCRMRIKSK